MGAKTRTGTRFKPMRIVWKDSAPRLSKSDRKMLAEKKENIEERVKEKKKKVYTPLFLCFKDNFIMGKCVPLVSKSEEGNKEQKVETYIKRIYSVAKRGIKG